MFWDKFWNLFGAALAILAAVVIISLLTLAGYSAFQGYQRHQEGARYAVALDKANTDLTVAKKQFEAYAYKLAMQRLSQ